MELYKIDAFGNVFADAYVGTESNELLFISLIGSQTEIRRLQAAITISTAEAGGISTIRGGNERHTFALRIPNTSHLGQHSGVINKTLFGDLVHLWIYNKELLFNPDYSNSTGYFLVELGKPESIELQVWNLFKTLAEIPLLDAWQDTVLKYGKRFYSFLGDHDQDIDVPCFGVKMDLSAGFTDFIQDLLKSNELAVQ